jgi:hypothetical protein
MKPQRLLQKQWIIFCLWPFIDQFVTICVCCDLAPNEFRTHSTI